MYSVCCICSAPSFPEFSFMGALREVWGKRSIWALLCGNGEMKLGSRLVEEQLSLDHLKEANRAERGLRLGVQKPRRCWGIMPGGVVGGGSLGAKKMEEVGDPSSKLVSSPSFPTPVSSLCFNLDTEQPTTFRVDSPGFGHSVVQYAQW